MYNAYNRVVQSCQDVQRREESTKCFEGKVPQAVKSEKEDAVSSCVLDKLEYGSISRWSSSNWCPRKCISMKVLRW